jgi:cold shock CspA family protein
MERAAGMVGIVKKVNLEGSGIIAVASGEKIPFVRSDVLNRQTLKPGERVVFSLRIAKGELFAQNIVPMPANH